ncbi:GntR family transcriptional regulator [Leucobacter weissii]|uniref:GntR family transcriptional regulator n=1 Tax=Leucobacter weissii TaxID=1983706 RepID=A0A939MNI5_9MICO|nr:GntR family transcriptional regulator [Leucobacter weissii]MBO1903090.1 GntR family transcriptional regulator [Leucobacter weissii]
MLLSIDAASERPIYAQLADAVRRAVARGELRVGEKLPPAGEVAIGLGVNKHTVLRAYQELRDEGLVDLRRGRGAVITSLADEIALLRRDAARIAERARGLGVSPRTLAALLQIPSPTRSDEGRTA